MQLHNHDLFEKFVRTKFLNTKQCLAGFSPRILLPISHPPPLPLYLKRHSPLMLLLLPPSGVDCVVLTEDLCWRLFRVPAPPPPPPFYWKGDNFQSHIQKREIRICHKFLHQGLPICLVYTFFTECHSRKHWNNLFWLVYDNYNKEFCCVYLFILHAGVGLFWRMWIQR